MTVTTGPEPAREQLTLRTAVREDCGLILQFIQDLADYEKLSHEVTATVDGLESSLFGSQPAARVVIAEWEGNPAGFALFFTNYSTFLGKPGIYLEDLFVRPEFRGKSIGKALLTHLASLVVAGEGGRLDWSVLTWNKPAIGFYEGIGAKAMSGWMQMRLEGEALQRMGKSQA